MVYLFIIHKIKFIKMKSIFKLNVEISYSLVLVILSKYNISKKKNYANLFDIKVIIGTAAVESSSVDTTKF